MATQVIANPEIQVPGTLVSTQVAEVIHEKKVRFFDRVGDALWRLSMVLQPYGACFTPGSGMNFRQSKTLSPREKAMLEGYLIFGL